MTIHCPLECEYLQEARLRQKPAVLDPETLPNRDIVVSEQLLRDNEELLTFLSLTVFQSAMETAGVVDRDVQEALDALIRTFRTLHSGLYYETRPVNPLAGAVFAAVQEEIAEYRRIEQEETGMTKTRDADCLGLLVFLQHFALDRDNGRRLGRAFLDALRAFHMAGPEPESSPSSASSIILP